MTFGKDVVIKGSVTVKNTSGTEKDDRSAMMRPRGWRRRCFFGRDFIGITYILYS
jgi:hypothetical protein